MPTYYTIYVAYIILAIIYVLSTKIKKDIPDRKAGDVHKALGFFPVSNGKAPSNLFETIGRSGIPPQARIRRIFLLYVPLFTRYIH